MASELSDALERLDLQAEQAAQQSDDGMESSSLSKYFGQPDPSDDIFDVIAKPPRPQTEEPKINLVLSPSSSKAKDISGGLTPSIAFKKGDEDSEPKIFSYFSQPSAAANSNKNEDATEFFDHISELATKSQEPNEITTFSSIPQPVFHAVQPGRPDSVEGGVSVVKASIPNVQASLAYPEHKHSPQFMVGATVPPQLYQETGAKAYNSPGFQEETNCPLERASRWWIPSEATQKCLLSMSATVKPEGYQPTCPGLSSNIELTDPVKELLRNLDGESSAAQRRNLTADHVTQDDRGIEDLIKAHCYRAAANLAGRLLTGYGQGNGKLGQQTKHSSHSLKLWYIRTCLLYRCRLFEDAMSEVSAFRDFDGPDLYHEFYPEQNNLKKRGSMVPFGFRLVAAMLPAQVTLYREAYAKLCRLLSDVRRVIKDAEKLAARDGLNESELKEAIALWSEREDQVEKCLVDCALMRMDYHNAVQLINKRIARAGEPADPALYTELGRVFLLLGDVMSAQQAFNRAADLRNINNPDEAVASLMDAGMVAIAQNAFPEAHGYFQKALALQPEHPAVVNNIAVCLLYMGCMRDAMLLLEENVGTNPETMIQDYTVLNVCTLYELESSLTAQRKLGMLRLASQWRADNLDVSSFKLSAP